MEFNYQLDRAARGYIQLTITGNAKVQDIEHMYEELMSYAGHDESKKILIDARHCILDYSMNEFIPLMKRLEQYLRQLRIARWVDVELFRNEIIETHAKNSDLQLKNFPCQEAALDWLLQE